MLACVRAAALARELEAKVEKANALAARSNERAVETEQALLQAFDANVKERVARAERELSLRFEGKVRAALSRAEAESSISKSLLKVRHATQRYLPCCAERVCNMTVCLFVCLFFVERLRHSDDTCRKLENAWKTPRVKKYLL